MPAACVLYFKIWIVHRYENSADLDTPPDDDLSYYYVQKVARAETKIVVVVVVVGGVVVGGVVVVVGVRSQKTSSGTGKGETQKRSKKIFFENFFYFPGGVTGF